MLSRCREEHTVLLNGVGRTSKPTQHFTSISRQAHIYRVDPGKLLRELQYDGNQEGLAVDRRTEEFQDGDLLLLEHLPALLFHLLKVSADVGHPTELL